VSSTSDYRSSQTSVKIVRTTDSTEQPKSPAHDQANDGRCLGD
jgi:hypothetical protein